MEWTKVKSQHFLYSNFTLIEHGALVRLLTLTAHLERLPLPSEIRRHVPERVCNKLAARFQALSTTLPAVLQKVLDDVETVNKAKQKSRQTSAKYRDTHEVVKKSDVSRNGLRREEKRRGEDSINGNLYLAINSLIAQGVKDKIDITNKLKSEYSEHDINEAFEHIQWHDNKEKKNGKK